MNANTPSIIYFDNAATSWPKPPGVAEAMLHSLNEVGANPGRAGHRLAVDASRIVYHTREKVCELFNAPDPLKVIFTANITAALNLALHGLLHPGDHVITSGMEHNAVMRPLRALEALGVEMTVVPCAPTGELNPALVEAAIQGNTRLVAVNHGSNVTGTLLPISEISQIVRRHGLLCLVDAAQTGGVWPINLAADPIDLLAFTGHKSLLGPMGTGGLVVGERVPLAEFPSLMQGGTGSRSEEEYQPEFLPDKFESGTLNAVGLAGLAAGIAWIQEQGITAIREHERNLTRHLVDGLRAIPGVSVYGPADPTLQTATVSFNIAGQSPSEVGLALDERFKILCRVGLHCAPAAHKTIGTFPEGTVRFGLGVFNTLAEVEQGVEAVRILAAEG